MADIEEGRAAVATGDPAPGRDHRMKAGRRVIAGLEADGAVAGQRRIPPVAQDPSASPLTAYAKADRFAR